MTLLRSVTPRRIGPKSAGPPNMNLSLSSRTSLLAHPVVWVWSKWSLQVSTVNVYFLPPTVIPPA
jgi:hypothetical protein